MTYTYTVSISRKREKARLHSTSTTIPTVLKTNRKESVLAHFLVFFFACFLLDIFIFSLLLRRTYLIRYLKTMYIRSTILLYKHEMYPERTHHVLPSLFPFFVRFFFVKILGRFFFFFLCQLVFGSRTQREERGAGRRWLFGENSTRKPRAMKAGVGRLRPP